MALCFLLGIVSIFFRIMQIFFHFMAHICGCGLRRGLVGGILRRMVAILHCGRRCAGDVEVYDCGCAVNYCLSMPHAEPSPFHAL